MKGGKFRVLYVPAKDPAFESVDLLQKLFFEALNGSASLKVHAAGSLSEDQYTELLRESDVVVGLDYELLRARKKANLGVPVILPSYGLGTRGLLPLWEMRDLLQINDSFICPSTSDLNAASAHIREGQIRLFYVPYPISGDYFNKDKISRRDIQRKFGLPVDLDCSSLLYVGRLNQQKNVHLIFYMIKELTGLGHDVQLLLAGSEDRSGFPELGWDNSGYESFLKELAKTLGVERRVHFLGSVDPVIMKHLYDFADVHATCSTFRTEDFGFAPVEAMARGTPTVGTAWGGFWDTIEEDTTGFRMPVYITDNGFRVDWRAGVLAIDRLLSSREYYLAMQKKCVARAKEKYSLSGFSESLLSVISELVRARNSAFRPINLESLLDGQALAFFSDLEKEISGGKSLFEARRSLFMKSPERVKAFFGAYSRIGLPSLSLDDVLYLPLPVHLQENKAVFVDRNWSLSTDLTDEERAVLQFVDGKNDIREIMSLSKLSSDVAFLVLGALVRKGLVIPMDRFASGRH